VFAATLNRDQFFEERNCLPKLPGTKEALRRWRELQPAKHIGELVAEILPGLIVHLADRLLERLICGTFLLAPPRHRVYLPSPPCSAAPSPRPHGDVSRPIPFSDIPRWSVGTTRMPHLYDARPGASPRTRASPKFGPCVPGSFAGRCRS